MSGALISSMVAMTGHILLYCYLVLTERCVDIIYGSYDGSHFINILLLNTY